MMHSLLRFQWPPQVLRHYTTMLKHRPSRAPGALAAVLVQPIIRMKGTKQISVTIFIQSAIRKAYAAQIANTVLMKYVPHDSRTNTKLSRNIFRRCTIRIHITYRTVLRFIVRRPPHCLTSGAHPRTDGGRRTLEFSCHNGRWHTFHIHIDGSLPDSRREVVCAWTLTRRTHSNAELMHIRHYSVICNITKLRRYLRPRQSSTIHRSDVRALGAIVLRPTTGH